MVRVRELRALLLWSDAGEAAQPVTQAELLLVLTGPVRQTAGHALEALGPGRLLVTEEEHQHQHGTLITASILI